MEEEEEKEGEKGGILEYFKKHSGVGNSIASKPLIVFSSNKRHIKDNRSLNTNLYRGNTFSQRQ